MTSVIVVGDLMADVVATVSTPLARGSDTPARIVTRPGGGGANVAWRLAEAGVPTLLVARVGEDAPGQTAIAELRAAGLELEIAIDATRPTGTCLVIVEPDGERTMLPDRGANGALEPADLPIDEFTEGRHLHLSGYTLLDAGSRSAGLVALEHARAAGMTISVDPASAAPLQDLGSAAFLGWTRRVTLLLPNAEEAAVLTGARDPEAAAWALAKDGREVVITLGDQGALWSDGERVERAPASPAPSRVDSTGAGDAFTAGWLASRLAGEEPGEALAAANFAAAQVLKAAGAR
jgi:ribokinase